MTQLLDLPSELISAIFQHLDDADFFATRRASRTLESASLTLFGRRFFRKKGYMLTTPSLNVLQSVAHSPKLKKYVQHVWFNPDCYTFITPACAPEDDIDCDDAENSDEDEKIEITQRVDLLSEEDRRRWEAYLEVMDDHTTLLEGYAKGLQSRVQDALDQLTNLKILGMRRSEDHSPWGWRRLRDAVGEDPRVLGPIPSQPATGLSSPSKLFSVLIYLVAKSNIRLQRLYTDAIEVDNIKPKRLRPTNLNAALKSVLYLEINIAKAAFSSPSHAQYANYSPEYQWGNGLLNVFNAAAPTLLELGLQIFPELRRAHWPYGAGYYGAETWKQRSYQYMAFQKIVDYVRFEHLTRLKLEKVVTEPEGLEAFLTPSKDKLTSLKMRDIRLLSSEEEGGRPWEQIFTFLLTSIPNLSYLLLYQLLYTHGGISFVPNPPRPSAATVNTNPGPAAVDTQDAGHFADLHAPEARGGGKFMEYEHVTLEAGGREEVVRKLGEVRERHWYCGNVYSYAMDEEVWHTDTSDEEW